MWTGDDRSLITTYTYLKLDIFEVTTKRFSGLFRYELQMIHPTMTNGLGLNSWVINGQITHKCHNWTKTIIFALKQSLSSLLSS